MAAFFETFFRNLLGLSLEAAPFLVLGLLATAAIRAFIPDGAMKKWIGGKGLGSIARAALVGMPLPLCSCGVIPAAVGLRRQGASPGATASFLVSTPETGVDSIAISYAMLGPFLTVARPVAAVVSAIATGVAVQAVAVKRGVARLAAAGGGTITLDVADGGGRGGPGTADGGGSCCGSQAQPAASCCHEEADGGGNGDGGGREGRGAAGRFVDGLRYASTTLLDDVAVWIVIGLVIAAVMLSIFEPSTLESVGRGPLAMIVMAVIGIPMYVCSVGATPLAAGLLLAGVSPGAVLVFLLAGPATNVATIGVVKRELGAASAAAYVGSIVVVSVLLGLATDAVVAGWGLNIAAQAEAHGHAVPTAVAGACLGLLALLGIKPLRKRVLW